MDDPISALVQRIQTRRRLPSPSTRRLVRERAGLSQQDLANALGVTRSAISLWEAGDRDPRPAHQTKYLELLDRIRIAKISP